MGHAPHSSKLVVIGVVLLLCVLFYVLFAFVLLYVLFVCKCVLYYCHRVSTQLQLTNISYIVSHNRRDMSLCCVDLTTRNPRTFFFMTIIVLFKWLTYVLSGQHGRQNEEIPHTVGSLLFFFLVRKYFPVQNINRE